MFDLRGVPLPGLTPPHPRFTFTVEAGEEFQPCSGAQTGVGLHARRRALRGLSVP